MASDESPRLCANGCGYFGWAQTRNLCTECYQDALLEEQKQPVSETVNANSSSTCADSVGAVASLVEGLRIEEESKSNIHVKSKDRCSCCHRRVRLANGFRCRCGSLYCSRHRYPEEHACTFDFKAAGRELLAKANPLVRADKLEERI